MGDDSIAGHKLCGFLCTVLSTSLSPDDKNPAFGTRCQIFGVGSDVGFKSDDGIVFSLINPNARALISIGGESTPPVGKTHNLGRECVASLSSKKKWSRMGLVHGSISVVHKLHALVTYKCLSIDARVIRTLVGNCGEARVLLLVDVYLPISVWSGWQFPKARSIAAALFRHMSCDWGARSSMLLSGEPEAEYNSDNAWSLCECHILGCKQNCSAPNTSKKKLFELHEIFKSLPSITKIGRDPTYSSRVDPSDNSRKSGIWVLSDDILIIILSTLAPRDLLSVSSTCRHLRSLASSVMPCMKLKLFPHQNAAVEWMLQRERDPKVLPHPLYKDFLTEDGFVLYINSVTGEIITDNLPTVRDFNGGMFCDEPGLGKTITALSLILKTQGTMADPPSGVQVIWCTHEQKKYGYYELSGETETTRRAQFFVDKLSLASDSTPPAMSVVQSTGSWSHGIKKNLMHTYGGSADSGRKKKQRDGLSCVSQKNNSSSKRRKKDHHLEHEYNDTWVQCDACRKWRKLVDDSEADNTRAWFCSMNKDHFHQSCSAPEESWDSREQVTHLPGFFTKGTCGGKEENVTFFTSVLKEHCLLMNSGTKKALTWLAKLSPDKLSRMETTGLLLPITVGARGQDFHKIFQAFGLMKRVEKGTTKWYYPRALVNLTFDLDALKIALCEPFNSVRLYLSRTTLVVVPSNLVDHWKNQIEKHVRPGQLRVFLWIDNRKPNAHNLAWDYDVVITTFSRLSAEWSPHKRSVLMQVHWLRVMFDEGHTLGSSLNLTNKLQISVSLTSSNRWILTGTPTPNTPNSQLSNLQPMLKFLREEAYGQNQKSWEAGILRPFEAEMEEGRTRLLQLLGRCMISARKTDLHMIPPCIKKAKFLNFTEEHARSYNELVVTVRRNILMADWNDPSHVESLLNPKQWKFRSNTIRNVRLSCCVAGHIKVTDAGEDIQETMDILVENGLDPVSEEYARIKYYLLHGGNCTRCNEWCRLPVITPCRHILCLDCVGLDSEKCTFPGCGNLYEMQSPETLARPENPKPKWPVPKDLIELQPSYKQDDWNSDWQSTSSSKVSYLVHRLKELQQANKDENNKLVPGQNPEGCSSPASKMIPVEKVLIFSQFLEHIHVIEQQLRFAEINFVGMYSPMHSANKIKSLATFQYDETCMVLLMDGTAALGLDLSFVTHVFLMEPIWDRSMEEQVISRAHRMGATRPINVETLAMRGTIEEQMLKFLMDTDERRKFLKEEYEKHEQEGTRAHRTFHDLAESNYLAQLSFVRTSPRHEQDLPVNDISLLC